MWEEPTLARFLRRYGRLAMGPGQATATYASVFEIDVRHVLPAIRVPTLVLHRTGDRHIRVGHGRYLGERIPGAKYVELPGDDNLFHVRETEPMLGEIEEFLTGSRSSTESDRVLGTVLFTDIVGSTERAAALGDAGWRDLLGAHDGMVRRELERHRGREILTTGDGSSPPSTGPRAECDAPVRSGTGRADSGSRCAPVCTRARSSTSGTEKNDV